MLDVFYCSCEIGCAGGEYGQWWRFAVGIARAELHRILYVEAERCGAVIHHGMTVTAVEQAAARVAVRMSDGTDRRVELRSQLRSIVTALLLAQPHSHTGELLDGPQPGYPRSVRSAPAFIEANLTEHLSLREIAAAADCSPRTLTAAFGDRIGVTPMSYIRNLRLERIRADILGSTEQVGTIAYRWGVAHLGRFAADYRDRFGELPSDTAARR